MEISILCFGITKEILGSFIVAKSIESDLSLAELMQDLKSQYPALNELPSIQIAINEEYQSSEYIIKPGDELVLIPPVSGG